MSTLGRLWFVMHILAHYPVNLWRLLLVVTLVLLFACAGCPRPASITITRFITDNIEGKPDSIPRLRRHYAGYCACPTSRQNVSLRTHDMPMAR